LSSTKITRALAICAVCTATPRGAFAADLNLFPDWTLVAANVVVFLLLVYPTTRLLLRPLVGVLEERARRTEGALEQARAFAAEASETRVEIQTRLRDAYAAAHSRRGEILAEAEEAQRRAMDRARDDAVRILESVRASVGEEFSIARGSLREQAGKLAEEIAGRVLGRSV
jgi:F-type H+-transporting ATPase subunit b